MSERPAVIVTGASSGIGAETALAYARRGYAVALAARRVERLEQVADACRTAGGEPLIVPTDVAEKDQVDDLVARTVEAFGRIDVMVNNAGYGLSARVWETDPDEMHAIMETNFFGVFYGCAAVAPIMTAARHGHIFNVSSVIGKRGTPFHGAYCATKFAVHGLTETLRVELKPYNVRVTSVCPGLTETEFFEKSARTRAAKTSFAKIRRQQPAAHVAKKIAAATGRNKPEMVFTAGGKILAIIAALCPRLADVFMKLYHDDLAKAYNLTDAIKRDTKTGDTP